MSYFKRFLLLLSIGVVLLAGLMVTSHTKGSSTAHASGCHTVATGDTGGSNPKPTWSDNCTVSQGNISNFVSAIQNTIYETHACGTLIVDGNFGPDTFNAVTCFQGKHDLTQDGIVGQLTWGKLANTLTYDKPASGHGWNYYYVDQGIGDEYREWANSGVWYLFVLSHGTYHWCQINLSSPC